MQKCIENEKMQLKPNYIHIDIIMPSFYPTNVGWKYMLVTPHEGTQLIGL